MARMIKFKLNRECRDIVVNPTKVLYVSHYENGSACVHFGRDCFVRVQGCVDDVARRIENALADVDVAPATSATGEGGCVADVH